jgi:DNA-binding XRE family transcriptional regulator
MRHERGQANAQTLAEHLRAAGEDVLDDPGALLAAVRDLYPSGHQPVSADEIDRLLDAMMPAAREPGVRGARLNDWKWNLGLTISALHRLREVGSGGLSTIRKLSLIRMHLLAHDWHVDILGRDRFEVGRWQVVDVFARAMLDVEPEQWEVELFAAASPAGAVIDASRRLADRIRRRRLRAGLRQEQLAAALGVSNTTVSRWETRSLAPELRHRKRLAELLGGTPHDYESEVAT